MPYQSTKTYGHEIGLSAAFRQWRAHSHCRFIHGYALAVKFVFEADEVTARFPATSVPASGLDSCNWVVDFGGLKALKAILEENFDHKLLVAEDDPFLDTLKSLEHAGVAQVIVVPATGCEAFAKMIYEVAEQWMHDAGFAPRARLKSVEVREHGANSAIYFKE